MFYYNDSFTFPRLTEKTAEQFNDLHGFVYSGKFDLTSIVSADVNAIENAFSQLSPIAQDNLLISLLDDFFGIYCDDYIPPRGDIWKVACDNVRIVMDDIELHGIDRDEFDYNTVRAWFLGVALDYKPANE